MYDREALNRKRRAELGIWSGIPMPWKDDEELDREALTQTVNRCVETGSHGIYVAGTTGEFHAMVETQYRAVVETFAEAMGDHPGTGLQIGCGGFSLRQVCDRVRVAMAQGCTDVQLPLPGWLPLQDDEALSFFKAVIDRFPAIRVYVYDNPHSGRPIGADLWPKLLGQVPAIVGAKLTRADASLVRDLLSIRPDFNILGGETNIISLWPHGVRSLAAWISYAFPKLIREIWDALDRDDREGIALGARKLDIIHSEIKGPLGALGYRDGMMDRLVGVASGFLDPVYCRVLRPWRSVDPAHVSVVREKIVSRLGEDYLCQPSEKQNLSPH